MLKSLGMPQLLQMPGIATSFWSGKNPALSIG
jgi:hypothetical protein